MAQLEKNGRQLQNYRHDIQYTHTRHIQQNIHIETVTEREFEFYYILYIDSRNLFLRISIVHRLNYKKNLQL